MYVWRFERNSKSSLLICHNTPIFIKDLTRKRQEKLLSQKRLKVRITVIGRIFPSLRYCRVTDWCITETFKLLWSVVAQELPSHTESSLAAGLVLIVSKRAHVGMEQWVLKYRHPHCKQGLWWPLCSASVQGHPQRKGKTTLCSR